MKHIVFFLLSFSVFGSIPLEQGLLRNLSNAEMDGNIGSLKFEISPIENSETKEFVKLIVSNEGDNPAILVARYAQSSMANNTLLGTELISDTISFSKKDSLLDKRFFMAIISMLTTNKSAPIESLLSKAGVQVTTNASQLSEEKMGLLKEYRDYLKENPGSQDKGSPLVTAQGAERTRLTNLFRSNSFASSDKVELIKIEKEFYWKVDWKGALALFTNEERRLRKFEVLDGTQKASIEMTDYILANSINEFPKQMQVTDSTGKVWKINLLGYETKVNRDKKLAARFEDYKKLQNPARKPILEIPFL